jgi:hypothetical protein
MSGAPTPARTVQVRPVSLALLLVSASFLGYLSGFPGGFGVLLAAGAVLLAALLRLVPEGNLASYAAVPALAGIALEAIAAPVGLGTELVAGLSALALLVWLADDPARPVGGFLRALPTVALPALALGIAWSSALFLPSGAVPLGVAGGLLALTVVAVALLAGRPTVFDQEEARS